MRGRKTQTIRLDQNCWELIGFNIHFKNDSLKSEGIRRYFQEKKIFY